ncbi:MAG: hypothetical protein H7141_05765, partial [Burkholderiales bacterium]|nr:hypothetical protein [Bacteroidia bacterium]
MKKLFFTFLISLTFIAYSQAPQEISYQGVARNASGSLLANQNIGIKLELHQGSAGGAVVFSETHSKTTNVFGLFTLGIGSINTAVFTAINWAGGPYFMEVSMDPAGGTSYTSVGTQQFMSVPYALYAKTAGNAAPTPTITINAPNTITSSGGSYAINIPATTSYSAGTGINLLGNTISNAAPDQTVVINAAGATTVTGTYPSFTINTPTAQAYTAGNGINISGAGVITNIAPPATPYTLTANSNTITINNGSASSTATVPAFSAGNGINVSSTGVITNTAIAITPTITGTGIAVVTPTTGNVFNVNVPAPVLGYNNGTNVLSLSQGTTVTTATLVGTGSNTISMVGSGLATVNPPTGNTFTVSVPNPTIAIANGSLSISNGNSVAIPSPSLTINSNSLTINGPGGNTVALNTYSAGTGISLTGSAPNFVINNTSTATTQTLTVTSNSVITSNLGGTATITPAVLSYTPGTNTLKLQDGLSVNSFTLNTTAATTLTQGANVSVTGGPSSFTIASPGYSLTSNSNTLTLSNGSSVTTATVSSPVAYVGTANNIAVTSNTINLAITGVTAGNYGANATNAVPVFSVDNFGRITTASQYTPNVAGDVIGSINASTVSKLRGTNISTVTPTPNQVLQFNGAAWIPSTLPPAVITGTGTGIATVTASVNNFTVSVPSPTYTPSNGVLSFGGTNTVVVSPTLTLSGTTLTSGAITNSVNLSSLAVWSNSVGVLYPTTLTNSVGIGTSGPLTDRMRIDHVSNGLIGSVTTHLHLKQIAGSDGFSRIKFSNISAPTKYWLNSVTSDLADVTSAYSVYYYNGSSGNHLFTISGDGKVGVNPFGTLPNSILDVKGRIRLDSSLTMASYISPPSLSPINEGKIYFDKPSGKFKVSENGLPYVNLIGGGSSPWTQSAGIVTLNNIGDKVGIGTNFPAFKLDVTGNGRFTTGIESNGQVYIAGSNNYQTFKAAEFNGLGAGINLQATGARGRSYTMYSANGSGLLNFDDETVGLTRMVIDSLGNIGIGTIAPAAKLDVVNTASTSSAGRFKNSSTTNTVDAVFVTNDGAGAAIHAALGPIVAGSSNLALMVDNGHIGTTDAGTVSVTFSSTCLCGVSVTADA